MVTLSTQKQNVFIKENKNGSFYFGVTAHLRNIILNQFK